MSHTGRIVSAVVLLICLSELVFAQGGATGAINGTVQDPSGSVLAGARVDVVSESTGQIERQLTTDSFQFYYLLLFLSFITRRSTARRVKSSSNSDPSM